MINRYDIVQKIAREYPHTFKNLNAGYRQRGKHTQDPKAWELTDRIIQKLHSIDPRFGYIVNDAHKFYSLDRIGYYTGEGNPQGKSYLETNRQIQAVDFLVIGSGNDSRLAGWHREEHTLFEKHPSAFVWMYPRPGAPNYGYDPDYPIKKKPNKKRGGKMETKEPRETLEVRGDEVRALRAKLAERNEKIRLLKGKIDELSDRFKERRETNPSAIRQKDVEDDDSLIEDIRKWFKGIFD